MTSNEGIVSAQGIVSARSTARRRLATVLVEGLDTPGIRIAEQLIALGIGTVLLRDEQPVTAADAAYRSVCRGEPRAEVACRMLRPAEGVSTVLEAPEDSAVVGLDLHLVVAAGASLWERLRSAEQNDAAVLPVELTAEGFCIGPLLGARTGLCCNCLLLHAAASEGRDDAVATGSKNVADPEPLNSLSATIAAAVAVQQAQLLIDGADTTAVESGALSAEARTGRISHRAVHRHSECHCLTVLSPSKRPARIRRRTGQSALTRPVATG